MLFLPSRELVFVVDDDPAILRGIARVLRQYGYDTVLLPSAEAFKNHNDLQNAACIILDINLNDGSGIELRHRLNAAGISVPVIYMTANDNPAARAAALQSGCLAYLTKPFSAISLIEPLKRALAGLA
jgi:FixJ family two-component response regulator